MLNLGLPSPFILFRLSFAEFHLIRFTSSGFCFREMELNEKKKSSEVEVDGFGDGNILGVLSEIFVASFVI